MRLDVGDGRRGTRRDLQMALEHLLEKIAAAPRTPAFELGVVSCANAQHDEVRTNFGADVVDCAATSPVKAIGDAQECGEFPHTRAINFTQRRIPGLGRLWFAPPMMAHERSEERDLVGFEAAQFAVLDEISGVTMVALPGDMLSDVV